MCLMVLTAETVNSRARRLARGAERLRGMKTEYEGRGVREGTVGGRGVDGSRARQKREGPREGET